MLLMSRARNDNRSSFLVCESSDTLSSLITHAEEDRVDILFAAGWLRLLEETKLRLEVDKYVICSLYFLVSRELGSLIYNHDGDIEAFILNALYFVIVVPP